MVYVKIQIMLYFGAMKGKRDKKKCSEKNKQIDMNEKGGRKKEKNN